MTFIVGSVIIGAGAAVAGGAIAAKGAKRGAEISAAGSDRELEFNRESRDLARADQAPYQKAGVTALNALMSMTGLGGGKQTNTQLALENPNLTPEQRAWHNQYQDNSAPGQGRMSQRDLYNIPEGESGGDFMNQRYQDGVDAGIFAPSDFKNPFRDANMNWSDRPPTGRAMGGPMNGNMYNINEMGPENVYSGGAMTRNPNPMTIDGQTGYVQPNIQGRAMGGAMGAASMGPARNMYDNSKNYPGGGLQPGRQQESPPRAGGGSSSRINVLNPDGSPMTMDTPLSDMQTGQAQG